MTSDGPLTSSVAAALADAFGLYALRTEDFGIAVFTKQSFERGATVYVFSQGQRIDDTWTLTAMNAVEVTLRDSESTKLKITVAQLRNGRYSLRPAPAY